MVQSGDEYPFWARWVVDGVVAADITSVNYVIREYNAATDAFDITEDSGIISSADAHGRWLVEFTVPVESDFKRYECEFTPVGGSHPVLTDSLDTLDGIATTVTFTGLGNETHSGTVCDTDGNPLQGVEVRAVPYGATQPVATDITDANGDYEITGLVSGHAYVIEFNKDGFWAKQSGTVIA